MHGFVCFLLLICTNLNCKTISLPSSTHFTNVIRESCECNVIMGDRVSKAPNPPPLVRGPVCMDLHILIARGGTRATVQCSPIFVHTFLSCFLLGTRALAWYGKQIKCGGINKHYSITVADPAATATNAPSPTPVWGERDQVALSFTQSPSALAFLWSWDHKKRNCCRRRWLSYVKQLNHIVLEDDFFSFFTFTFVCGNW